MTTTTDKKQAAQDEKTKSIYLVTYTIKTPEGPHVSQTITEIQTSTLVKSPYGFLNNLQSGMFSSTKLFHTILREDGVAVSVRKENIIDMKVQDITEKSSKEGFQIRCPKCNNVSKISDRTYGKGKGDIAILEYSVDAQGVFDSASGYKLSCGVCSHQVKTDGRYANAATFAWYVEEDKRTEDDVVLKPFFLDAKGAEGITPVNLVSSVDINITSLLRYYKDGEGIINYPIYGYINTSDFVNLKFKEYQLVRIQDAIFSTTDTGVQDKRDYEITSFIVSIDGHKDDHYVAAKDMLIAATRRGDVYDVLI